MTSLAFTLPAQAQTPPAPAQPADPPPAPAAEPTAAPAPAAEPAPAAAPAAEPAPAAAPAPAAPAAAPPPAAAPAPPAGAPRVHIEADRVGARLLRIDGVISDVQGEAILVRTACVAPCDRVVDAREGQTFFVGAPGMIPTRGFSLAQHRGDVTVRVDGGSMGGRQFGYVLGGLGAVGLVGGAIMLATGYGGGDNRITGDGKVGEGQNQALTTGGFVALGAGGALAVTGLVLVLATRTSVEIVPGKGGAAGVRLQGGRLLF